MNLPLYVVAGSSYWAGISTRDQRLCRRVRVVQQRRELPDGASVYTHKAEAFEDALRTHRDVVRETQTSSNAWAYQLLLQGITGG